jgi:hypothetical protein
VAKRRRTDNEERSELAVYEVLRLRYPKLREVRVALPPEVGLVRFPDLHFRTLLYTSVHFWIMPKRLYLEDHLSSEELEYRYRKAKDPVLRTHLLIIWQPSLGKTTCEISATTRRQWRAELTRSDTNYHWWPDGA